MTATTIAAIIVLPAAHQYNQRRVATTPMPRLAVLAVLPLPNTPPPAAAAAAEADAVVTPLLLLLPEATVERVEQEEDDSSDAAMMLIATITTTDERYAKKRADVIRTLMAAVGVLRPLVVLPQDGETVLRIVQGLPFPGASW